MINKIIYLHVILLLLSLFVASCLAANFDFDQVHDNVGQKWWANLTVMRS